MRFVRHAGNFSLSCVSWAKIRIRAHPSNPWSKLPMPLAGYSVGIPFAIIRADSRATFPFCFRVFRGPKSDSRFDPGGIANPRLPQGIENPQSKIENFIARVAKLADATVLEAVSERIRGSSPLPSTSETQISFWLRSIDDRFC